MTKTHEETEQDFPHDKAQELYLKACERLFSELAEGSLMLGVRYTDLEKTLKSAVIAVAKKRIKKFKKQDNFISIATSLTGIQRAGLKVEERNLVIAQIIESWPGSQDQKTLTVSSIELIELVNKVLEKRKLTNEFTAKAVINSMAAGGYLLESPENNFALQETHNQTNTIIGRIVQLWRNQDRYPLERLPRRTQDDSPSLTGLVNQILLASRPKSEVRAKAVIAAMEVAGVIYEGPKDHFNLHHRAFRTDPEVAKDFEFLRKNVGDHLACALHNCLHEKSERKMFERAYFSDSGVSAKTISKIRAAYTNQQEQESVQFAHEHRESTIDGPSGVEFINEISNLLTNENLNKVTKIYFDHLNDIKETNPDLFMVDFMRKIKQVVPDDAFLEIKKKYKEWDDETNGLALSFLREMAIFVRESESQTSNLDDTQDEKHKFRAGLYFYMPNNSN